MTATWQLRLDRAITQTWTFAVATPVKAALTHGNQALVTLASAYMNAQFAQSHGILEPVIAWLLAVGYEWTYLRGLASADKARSNWTIALNGVAFLTAIIGGLLYCADKYGALPANPTDGQAWGLAAAHVLPMALLSLCSAMVHRAAALVERAKKDEEEREAHILQAEREKEEHARLVEWQKEQDKLALEKQRKEQEIEIWKAGKVAMQSVQPASKNNARSRHQKAPNAEPALHTCASCGASLTAKQYAAAKRWGRCGNCPKEGVN